MVDLPETLSVSPLAAPPDVSVVLPGSKSITNRALLCAALATGRSALHGALFADDTRAMIGAVRALGATVSERPDECCIVIDGAGESWRESTGEVVVNARASGTTSRFVAPVAALRSATTVIDGEAQLRTRPFGDLVGAIRGLGATVSWLGGENRLPIRVCGPITGSEVAVSGDVSSQFLSGLMLAAPLTDDGLTLRASTAPVSRPYLSMTAAVMSSFGARVRQLDERTWRVEPGGYRPCEQFRVEPDASAASYFFAAAAITGGRVRVDGLGSGSLQGDTGFARVLARMGCDVEIGEDHVQVRGRARRGIDVDLADLSDTAPTMAVVAALADEPSTVSGIGFIRHKESDRITACVAELNRCGVGAEITEDGFVVRPGGPVEPARIRTYDDHRMAMSFSLLGLVADGIEIDDPGCVAKTFPGFFDSLGQLSESATILERPGGDEAGQQAGCAPMRVIAIDGPAGSGKSTVARAVADRLDLEYLDTGAMYRAVAFAVLRNGGDPADADYTARLAQAIEIEVGREQVLVDGVDATLEIRGPEVTRSVSVVAANPEVRREMVARQREWTELRGGGVLEGRDIGTVVFPDASLKVYLTADPEVRARRRAREVTDLDYETVAADLARRDALDSGRDTDPLVEATDASVIDTTGKSIDEVVDEVVQLLS